MEQASLFDPPPPPPSLPAGLPPGLVYEPDFLSVDEEASLIALIVGLPLAEAVYKQYTARRRVVSFGGSFDYDANRLLPAAPLPPGLQPLRERVAQWAGLDPSALVHALVAEYAPGTPLGWHRDVPDFEDVFGVSLGTPAVMRLRPYRAPATAATAAAAATAPAGAAAALADAAARDAPARRRRSDVVKLTLAPRSAYTLRGAARWGWQHSVAPVAALRWSITFRTRAAGRR